MGNTAYLVDKDTIFRHGLKQILAANFDTISIGQQSSILAAEQEIRVREPDLLFLGAGDDLYESLPVIRRVKSAFPRIKLVYLADSVSASVVNEALSLQLHAYARKPINLSDIEALFDALQQGRRYLGHGFANFDNASSPQQSTGQCDNNVVRNRLSNRETQILVRTVNGKTAAAIAAEFDISVKTAEWHRRNVYSKLHVKNVAELTKFALRAGIIALD